MMRNPVLLSMRFPIYKNYLMSQDLRLREVADLKLKKAQT